jgi:hypothetical protein
LLLANRRRRSSGLPGLSTITRPGSLLFRNYGEQRFLAKVRVAEQSLINIERTKP